MRSSNIFRFKKGYPDDISILYKILIQALILTNIFVDHIIHYKEET